MIKKIRKRSFELFKEENKKKSFFLIRFNGYKGILRCKNTEKEDAIDLLKSIESINSAKVKIKTVGTSGTIKSLIKKHLEKY